MLETVSLTTFCTPLDQASTTVAVAYNAGGGSITVANGSAFGSPSGGSPLRITAYHGSTRVHYKCTGVAGNVLTVVAMDGYTDINLSVGDAIGSYTSAEFVADLNAAVAANQAAINQHAANAAPLSAPTFVGTVSFSNGSGVVGTISEAGTSYFLIGAAPGAILSVTAASGMQFADGGLFQYSYSLNVVSVSSGVGVVHSWGAIPTTNSTAGYVGYQFAVQTGSANGSGASWHTQWLGGAAGTTKLLQLDAKGNLAIGPGGLTATSTDGYLYIPNISGAPTGTPTAKSGYAPVVYDTANNKIWVYNGSAWKGVALS